MVGDSESTTQVVALVLCLPRPLFACGEAFPALKGGEEDIPKFKLWGPR